METILSILTINDVIVYFVYGQVFFTLGIAIALHSHKHTQLSLARDLRWLAAFGIMHGLNEWAHIFIPIQASYLPGSWITVLESLHVLVLAVSFYLLLQYGFMVAFPRSRRSNLKFFPIAVLLLWLAMAGRLWNMDAGGSLLDLRSADAALSARLVLGFTGATLTAFGLLRQAQSIRELHSRGIARYFFSAALCMGFYAITAGLVSPREFWEIRQLSPLPFTQELINTLAPALRSLAGLGIAFSVIRGLEIFDLETDKLIGEAEQGRIRAADRARLALDAIAATVSRRLRKDILVGVALEKVLEIMDNTVGWAMLVREGDGTLEVCASRGFDTGDATRISCPASRDCVCERVLTNVEPSSMFSIGACRFWSGANRPGAFVTVPLKAQDRLVGILNLANRDYGAEELGLLTSIGKQIGLAIENARLWDELQREEEERKQLLGRVIVAQEDERKRVARELHDETGQNLSAVIMGLGAASEVVSRDSTKAGEILEDTREIAIGALEGIRQMILGLRPSILDDLGLVPALRRLADDYSRRSSTEICVSADGLDGRLPSEVETVLFRILQEGMNNVARHSKARHAKLRLSRTGANVEAVLEDDGLGFEPAKVTTHLESGFGLGLIGMRERASLLGGKVIIDSKLGRGARLRVLLPLKERN